MKFDINEKTLSAIKESNSAFFIIEIACQT